MSRLPYGSRKVANAESCVDLIRCMYNLTELDIDVMGALVSGGPARAEDLAERLDRDRSTVYRALQKLVSCQLVSKEARSLDRGGYYHVYAAVPPGVIKERLEACVGDWHGRMIELLARFDEDMGEL